MDGIIAERLALEMPAFLRDEQPRAERPTRRKAGAELPHPKCN
jgi:hypothetical protein